ncbi:MAG: hypothetical protein Pg6B_11100 [Candidatus Azobacteroides pseudotrichonymphae]|nr:MAG: hypothetical protein Pg6B_11100 [Candidatus Azobacteroides pseudotrichonymphae]
MKKILLTLLFIVSTALSYGNTHITIQFKNNDIFTYNFINTTGVTEHLFHFVTDPDEQWNAGLDHLPRLAEGEAIIGTNTLWEDKAAAEYQAVLDLRQVFRSRGYRAEVWQIYYYIDFFVGNWEQAVYFDKKDVIDVKIQNYSG